MAMRNWSVAVTVEGVGIVQLSNQDMSGIANVTDFREEILAAADNLIAFIGRKESTWEPDAAPVAKCRRCAECEGMDHHWIPNPEFGDDDAPEESREWDYACKHCPAMGKSCSHCFGDGCEPADEGQLCSVCDGEGVVSR